MVFQFPYYPSILGPPVAAGVEERVWRIGERWCGVKDGVAAAERRPV
jgi:hypothetical protein